MSVPRHGAPRKVRSKARTIHVRTPGHDVSYPQCGGTLPAGSFAIVNTADPGPKMSTHWPKGQTSPQVCKAGSFNSTTCSYDYGWNAAKDSYARAAAAASTVGVYSTSHQWQQITGGASVAKAPVWYAGVVGPPSAAAHCASSYSFTGGPVRLTQFRTGRLRRRQRLLRRRAQIRQEPRSCQDWGSSGVLGDLLVSAPSRARCPAWRPTARSGRGRWRKPHEALSRGLGRGGRRRGVRHPKEASLGCRPGRHSGRNGRRPPAEGARQELKSRRPLFVGGMYVGHLAHRL
jgi:hypothetical protein